jgi:hypothetical protein
MKDKWDFAELEVKVDPDGKYARLVELAGLAGPPGSKMVRKPHVAFFDLYLDSPSFALAENGAYLRFRFSKVSFRRKGKYKLFFKENGPSPEGAKFLSRREVRTDLSYEEASQYSKGCLPGTAAELAYSVLEQAGEVRLLVPVCVVSSFRRYFTMRTLDQGNPDYLNLGIEQSTAIAARDFDVELLLKSGFIDAPMSSQTYDFELAEAELTTEVEEGYATFKRLVDALSDEFKITTGSKYLTCLAELGLRKVVVV